MKLNGYSNIMTLKELEKNILNGCPFLQYYWWTFKVINKKRNKPEDLKDELNFMRVKFQMDLSTFVLSQHYQKPDEQWYRDEFKLLKTKWPEFAAEIVSQREKYL